MWTLLNLCPSIGDPREGRGYVANPPIFARRSEEVVACACGPPAVPACDAVPGLQRHAVASCGSYSVAHRAGLLPTELTGMCGWILLRSPHQGRGSPPAPATTKQRSGTIAVTSVLLSHAEGGSAKWRDPRTRGPQEGTGRPTSAEHHPPSVDNQRPVVERRPPPVDHNIRPAQRDPHEPHAPHAKRTPPNPKGNSAAVARAVEAGAQQPGHSPHTAKRRPISAERVGIAPLPHPPPPCNLPPQCRDGSPPAGGCDLIKKQTNANQR